MVIGSPLFSFYRREQYVGDKEKDFDNALVLSKTKILNARLLDFINKETERQVYDPGDTPTKRVKEEVFHIKGSSDKEKLCISAGVRLKGVGGIILSSIGSYPNTLHRRTVEADLVVNPTYGGIPRSSTYLMLHDIHENKEVLDDSISVNYLITEYNSLVVPAEVRQVCTTACVRLFGKFIKESLGIPVYLFSEKYDGGVRHTLYTTGNCNE